MREVSFHLPNAWNFSIVHFVHALEMTYSPTIKSVAHLTKSKIANRSSMFNIPIKRRRAERYPCEGESEFLFDGGGSEEVRRPRTATYKNSLSRARFKRSTPSGAHIQANSYKPVFKTLYPGVETRIFSLNL